MEMFIEQVRPQLVASCSEVECQLTCLSITAAEDEGRPIHLLQASLPRIRQFVEDKLPQSSVSGVSAGTAGAGSVTASGDVEMASAL